MVLQRHVEIIILGLLITSQRVSRASSVRGPSLRTNTQKNVCNDIEGRRFETTPIKGNR